jgi:hypothetical protein
MTSQLLSSLSLFLLLATPAKAEVTHTSLLFPAQYCAPGHVRKLAVVARPDTQDANILVDLFNKDLRQLSWFKATHMARGQLAFNSHRNDPITEKSAAQVCEAVHADGIIVLESLSSNKAKRTHSTTTISAISGGATFNSGGSSIPLMAASSLIAASFRSSKTTKATKAVETNEIEVATAHWGFYDCNGSVLSSVRASGQELAQLTATLIRHIHPVAIRATFVTIDEPWWMNNRGAAKAWRLGNYSKAASSWANAAEKRKGAFKLKALNNAILAHVAAWEPELAIQATRKAHDLMEERKYPLKMRRILNASIDTAKSDWRNHKLNTGHHVERYGESGSPDSPPPAQAQKIGKTATISARQSFNVKCMDESPRSSALLGTKHVVNLPLENSAGCSINIGGLRRGITLSPGDRIFCTAGEAGTTCNKSR